MTDLLETMKTICETGNASYAAGYADAKAELCRRLTRALADESLDPIQQAEAILAVMNAFIV